MAHPQFTIELEDAKKGLYSRIPHALLKIARRNSLKRCSSNLLGMIFTHTRKVSEDRRVRDEQGLWHVVSEERREGYRFTYDSVQKELGRGRSTVASAFEELRDLKLVKKIDRDGNGTQYVYDGAAVAGQYITVPRYLYTMQACIEGTWRTLTDAEVIVLAYIMSECSAPMNGGDPERGGGYCKTSYRMLAALLGLAQSTVRRAVSALLKGNFIRRRKGQKGVNGKQLSKYTVSSKLFIFRKYKKRYVSEKEYTEIRNQYYKDLQNDAKAYASKCYAEARRHMDFRDNEIDLLDAIEAYKAAEKTGDRKVIYAAAVRKKAAQAKGRAVLARLGLEPKDLKVQVSCTCCNDVGYLDGDKDKLCPCFPGGTPWKG